MTPGISWWRHLQIHCDIYIILRKGFKWNNAYLNQFHYAKLWKIFYCPVNRGNCIHSLNVNDKKFKIGLYFLKIGILYDLNTFFIVICKNWPENYVCVVNQEHFILNMSYTFSMEIFCNLHYYSSKVIQKICLIISPWRRKLKLTPLLLSKVFSCHRIVLKIVISEKKMVKQSQFSQHLLL